MEVKGHLLYYPEGKHDINLGNYVLKSQLNDALKSKVDSITKTTYADLKNLRDNSQLTPGSLYRITDYINTTDVTFDGLTSHQFDIILLALTPNTLAEEGWAAMHDNIYDVTFNDGVTKKCYLSEPDSDNYVNIVDVETLLGSSWELDVEIFIDNDKTAHSNNVDSTALTEPNLTYNYFQNRNLSTWKVWYSLDNDTARFSWADNGNIIPGEVQSIQLHYKYNNTIVEGTWYRRGEPETYQGITGYKWEYKYIIPGPNIESYQYGVYTTDEYPTIDSKLYIIGGGGPATFFNEITNNGPYYGTQILGINTAEPTIIPGGTGIIYRLTDESGLCKLQWNELKTIRDSKALVADTKYRIVDYQCTTTQENTQSAGHQFDIVLLALSANKLAEEGWAMMHDNIYDVTFADGVTKKCWLYNYTADYYTIVDIETNLGLTNLTVGRGDIIVNNATKTATTPAPSNAMTNPNLTYNYFQNSNLSAWKVWYCLDNDTTRFAWADDSVDEDVPAFITRMGEKGELHTYYRDSADDLNNLFAWKEGDGAPFYTASQTPSAGDTMYNEDRTDAGITVNSFTPAHQGTGLPNGRGVIYRLIDEWNNDVPYDFKNILYLTKVNAGSFDVHGIEKYLPTFCLYDNGNNEYKDASIFAIQYVNDEEGVSPCYNNSINSESAYNSSIDYSNKYCYALPCIIFLNLVESGSYSWGTINNKLFNVHNTTFEGNCATNIVLAGGANYIDLCESFVCGHSRASMESI